MWYLLLFYYKRTQPRNSHREEIHRARYGEEVGSFHALSKHAILPTHPCVHPHGTLQIQDLVFLYRHVWLSHWPLKTNKISIPLPNLGVGEVGLAKNSNPLISHMAGCPGNQPLSLETFQMSCHKLRYSSKGFVIKNKRPLYCLYHLGKSKCFWISVPGAKYIFLTINHSIIQENGHFLLFFLSFELTFFNLCI